MKKSFVLKFLVLIILAIGFISTAHASSALELLKDNGINPKVVLYLQTPPSEKELVLILKKLNLEAKEMLRKGEAEFKELKLSDSSKSEEDLIKAMINFPKLMERPIIINRDRAVIGRPPENVLKIIK